MSLIRGEYTASPNTATVNGPLPVLVDSQGRIIVVTSSASATVAAYGTYNSSPPTLVSGNTGSLQLDINGNLKVVEQYAPVAEDNTNGVISIAQKPVPALAYSPTIFNNRGANATLNVKATPGNVFSAMCINANAAVRYFQLHNTATVPSSGTTVPIFSFLIPASLAGVNGVVIVDSSFFTTNGTYFSSGIAFAFSTTQDVYTAGAAADQSTTVLFI